MSLIMIQNIIKPKISRNFSKQLSLYLGQNDSIKSLEEGLCYDVAVIGGGIIGTAIAREIRNTSTDTKIILIEKESSLGKHQSSHNSGVIHSGLYYKPGSLKSKLCVRGRNLVIDYCTSNKIPFKTLGKLIVATNSKESEILDLLATRGKENQVQDLRLLNTSKDIREIEPQSKGCKALWSPNTGITNFKVLTQSLGKDFQHCGGDVLLNNEVKCIKPSSDCDYPLLVKCNENLYVKSKYLVICGGLQSGTILNLIESESNKSRVLFVSFRVNYQLLKNETISTNIYAVPELDLPFLGVHLSPRIEGDVLLGPTAVPAYQIEGYKADDINLTYLKNTLTSPNFQNMTKRHCSKCVSQVTKRLFPRLQIKELQKLAEISEENVLPGPVAVQVQLVNEDGTFEEDFVFEFFEGNGIRKRVINCVFMPSPAATSSLAVAEYVTERLFREFSK